MTQAYHVHHKAICDATNIGDGTRIWAFSHVMERAKIGKNCNIGEHCFIENDVVIGDDCVIKNNICVWDGLRVGNQVFFGPNVVLTNDLKPRAKVFHEKYVQTTIQDGASIGANATLICGINVGQYAMIGAGAVVTRDVPDFGLVYGNPARLTGYVCICAERLVFNNERAECICGRKYAKDGQEVVQLEHEGILRNDFKI